MRRLKHQFAVEHGHEILTLSYLALFLENAIDRELVSHKLFSVSGLNGDLGDAFDYAVRARDSLREFRDILCGTVGEVPDYGDEQQGC